MLIIAEILVFFDEPTQQTKFMPRGGSGRSWATRLWAAITKKCALIPNTLSLPKDMLTQIEREKWSKAQWFDINLTYLWKISKKISSNMDGKTKDVHCSNNDVSIAMQRSCTALKAADLLSCLQMKIVSLEQCKTKCNIWERFGSRSLSVILSLLRWTMILCEELACQLCALLLLCPQRQLVLWHPQQNIFWASLGGVIGGRYLV